MPLSHTHTQLRKSPVDSTCKIEPEFDHFSPPLLLPPGRSHVIPPGFFLLLHLPSRSFLHLPSPPAHKILNTRAAVILSKCTSEHGFPRLTLLKGHSFCSRESSNPSRGRSHICSLSFSPGGLFAALIICSALAALPLESHQAPSLSPAVASMSLPTEAYSGHLVKNCTHPPRPPPSPFFSFLLCTFHGLTHVCLYVHPVYFQPPSLM